MTRTWQSEEYDFVLEFDDFIDLSIVVSSIANNNVRNRWIICDFNDFSMLIWHFTTSAHDFQDNTC